jgi:hypothetical protein
MAKQNPGKISGIDRLKAAASTVNFPQARAVIPPPPVDLWQIVVVGMIDVRQHHPLWYELIGCISPAEKIAGLKSQVAIVLPSAPGMPMQGTLMQFDVGGFAIICTPDKWTIQTSDDANRSRILTIATTIFRKLNEISIVAYGINRTMSVDTGKTSGKQFLSDKVAGIGLGLERGNSECQIVYTTHLGDSDTTVQIAPSSVGERGLHVFYNRNHPIGPQVGYYDLGDMLILNGENDWKMAEKYRKDLIAFVDGSRVSNGL